jgi:hypothetical protein
VEKSGRIIAADTENSIEYVRSTNQTVHEAAPATYARKVTSNPFILSSSEPPPVQNIVKEAKVVALPPLSKPKF